MTLRCPIQSKENTWTDNGHSWEFFCKQRGLLKINNLNCIKWVSVCLNFAFDLNGFHLKKLKIIQYLFLNWRAEENLVVDNIDNRVFMSRNCLTVAPWKFDVLKTSKYLFMRTSNFLP